MINRVVDNVLPSLQDWDKSESKELQKLKFKTTYRHTGTQYSHHLDRKDRLQDNLPFFKTIYVLTYLYISTGCSGKIVFFTINCNPSLAYIAVGDLQSTGRNASVQSLLLTGNFLYNQQQPSAGEREVANFRESLKKKHNINEHPANTC